MIAIRYGVTILCRLFHDVAMKGVAAARSVSQLHSFRSTRDVTY